MPLRIVHYNEPVLRTKGAKVTAFDAALARLSADMVDTMHEAEGIGLAAQQVGHAIQLCVVDLRGADARFTWELDGAKPPLELIMPMTLANPVITAVPGSSKGIEAKMRIADLLGVPVNSVRRLRERVGEDR